MSEASFQKPIVQSRAAVSQAIQTRHDRVVVAAVVGPT